MIRSIMFVGALGALTAALVAGLFTGPMRRDVASNPLPMATESWPICSTMGAVTEGETWAPLDPDFVAGKRALAAADWNGAIAAFKSAALRDTRNADIQNYLGYAHRRLVQLDLAFAHYHQALTLNPRHRGAHGHLGEAYLVVGDLAEAEAHLEAIKRICLIPCDEQSDLARAIAIYRARSEGRRETSAAKR